MRRGLLVSLIFAIGCANPGSGGTASADGDSSGETAGMTGLGTPDSSNGGTGGTTQGSAATTAGTDAGETMAGTGAGETTRGTGADESESGAGESSGGVTCAGEPVVHFVYFVEADAEYSESRRDGIEAMAYVFQEYWHERTPTTSAGSAQSRASVASLPARSADIAQRGARPRVEHHRAPPHESGS